MNKKGLVLLLCLALVALVAVNDTLAAKVGNVFRNIYDALGNLIDTPQPTNGTLNVDIVSTTDAVLIPSHYEDPFAWEKVNPVTKTTYAQNTAEETAFVRICIAVKTDDVLRYQPPVGLGYVTATIPQKGYTVYTFDYTGTLEKGAKTPEITMQVALTKETNNDDLARLGNDFIKVQSFAIQASAFANLDENGNRIPDNDNTTKPMKPETALNNALGDRASFNPFN